MRKTVSSVRQWNWPALLGWLVFALALTGFDQWTKNWIQHRLITGDVDRITDFFNLVVAYNSGAAFSFLADAGGWQRPLFAGLAIVVSLVICVIIARNSSRKFLCLGLALVLSERARQRLGPIHYRCSRRLFRLPCRLLPLAGFQCRRYLHLLRRRHCRPG